MLFGEKRAKYFYAVRKYLQYAYFFSFMKRMRAKGGRSFYEVMKYFLPWTA